MGKSAVLESDRELEVCGSFLRLRLMAQGLGERGGLLKGGSFSSLKGLLEVLSLMFKELMELGLSGWPDSRAALANKDSPVSSG